MNALVEGENKGIMLLHVLTEVAETSMKKNYRRLQSAVHPRTTKIEVEYLPGYQHQFECLALQP